MTVQLVQERETLTRLIGSVEVPVRVTPWGVIAHITPEIARALLAQNTRNRRARSTRSDLYARDMHRWALNGETITFTSDGTLINGQHRLEGCVKADTAFESFIIGDLPEEARDTVDAVLPRSLADVLEFEQEADGRTLASMLMLCWKIENNGTLLGGAGIPYPTRSDLAGYLESNPHIRLSVPVAARAAKALRFPKSVAGGLHYLMSRRSPERAEAFWEEVIDGSGLQPGDPTYALRLALIGQMARVRRAEIIDVAAWTIKAWNAYRDKRRIKTLRWRRAGDNPERFPEVR